MSVSTGNKQVIGNLQNALEDFLADHRRYAQNNPKWVLETDELTEHELSERVGCGCDDCILAGQLLGRI